MNKLNGITGPFNTDGSLTMIIGYDNKKVLFSWFSRTSESQECLPYRAASFSSQASFTDLLQLISHRIQALRFSLGQIDGLVGILAQVE